MTKFITFLKSIQVINITKLVILTLLLLNFSSLYAQVKVKGYYRKDGTYVKPHYRSNPDGNPYNNWSYPGNTNPYTGKIATGNEDTYLKNYYDNSNYYSTNNNNSSQYSFNGSGKFIIYTDIGNIGDIDIYIDGNYVGTLNRYFSIGNPSYYGEEGTISTTISGGYHKVYAISSDGTYWSNTNSIYANTNNILKLTK